MISDYTFKLIFKNEGSLKKAVPLVIDKEDREESGVAAIEDGGGEALEVGKEEY